MVYINDVGNSLLLTPDSNSGLGIKLLRTTTDEDIWLKVNSIIVEVTRTDSVDIILASLVVWILVDENFVECTLMLEVVNWTVVMIILTDFMLEVPLTDFMIEVPLTDFVDVSLIVLISLVDWMFVKANFVEFISMLGVVNGLEAMVVVTAIDWILEVILADLMVEVSSMVFVILVLISLTMVIVESILSVMGKMVLAIVLDEIIVSLAVTVRRVVVYGVTLE